MFFDQVKKRVCAYILTINKLHFNKIFKSNFFPLVCKLQNTIGCHFRCCSKEQCLVLWKKPVIQKVTPRCDKCSLLLPSITDFFVNLSLQNSILAFAEYTNPLFSGFERQLFKIFKKTLDYKRIFKHIHFMRNIVWKAS